MKKMFRYEVPIDDQDHEITLKGGWPVSAAVVLDTVPYVEFWAEHNESDEDYTVAFRVFGTGHEIENLYVWEATCPRVSGLVFHLYSLAE